MPTYEYTCTHCHKIVEVSQKMSDEPLKDCPHCQQPTLKRGPGGGVGFQLTGSGFYKTDYTPSKAPAEESPTKDAGGGSCGGGCACH